MSSVQSYLIQARETPLPEFGILPEVGPPVAARPPQEKRKSPASSVAEGIPREHAFRLSARLLIGDAIVAFGAVFIAFLFREWQRADVNPTLFYTISWSAGSSILLTWFMAMFRTYETSNLYRMRTWSKNLLKSTALWSIILWACIGFFRIDEFSPRIGTFYAIISLLSLCSLWRVVAFMVMIQPRVKEAASSRVIVVGWNEKIAHLRGAMRRDLSQLCEIVGCVPMPGGKFGTRPPKDLAVLGDYSSLPQLVSDCDAHSIILADVSCPAREIRALISFCQREMIRFQMMPQYFPALNSGLQIETVSGVALLGVNQLPLDRTVNRVAKRCLDIVGSMIGLCICCAVVPLFTLLVYWESPGPVIFRQRRMSRSGRTFYIYKIRSMKLSAEAKSGPVWCKQDDDRRLKIGAFMRKTNIDELPQFWNVMKGEMSLVGPRPERPELIEKFKNTIPNYNARHEVRSGLTGWAQINGLRGDTDLTKRIEADLYYLENWSLWLDVHCLFSTVFKNKNAY